MPRLGIVNMLVGFSLLFLAASAGAFIATDITESYVIDKANLDSWRLLLQSSSHGHVNLFGMIHICFGLTLPYSKLSLSYKKLQTVGLACGSLAMGPGLLWRAQMTPTTEWNMVELAVGAGLSLALLALGAHAVGLAMKLMKLTKLKG